MVYLITLINTFPFSFHIQLDSFAKIVYNILILKWKAGERKKLKLKEIRQIKGLKASDVAEKLSITKNSLSEWESGKRIPPCERIIQLADFYNVSVDYLLGRDDSFDTNNDSVRPISKSTLSIFDGRPVWIDGHGWALVSSTDQTLLFSDGRKI